MVQLRDKRLVIDGKPVLVLCGEIHYFRLAKGDWEDRVRKLKDLGCNAVASYIPWTDFHRPGPMEQIVQGLEQARDPLDDLTRALLALGFRFPAVDLQHRPIDSKCLALASSAYMPLARIIHLRFKRATLRVFRM